MDTTAIYRDAFAPYHARLVEQGERRIRAAYTRAVELAGPAVWMLSRYDLPLYQFWLEVVAKCCRRNGTQTNSPVYIDDAKLATFVANWADMELAAAVEKLASKVGSLDNVTVDHASYGAEWFTVTGARSNGDTVTIVQNQTINVSCKGKLFNQWPALIYVNGKKVSEAQYKRMV